MPPVLPSSQGGGARVLRLVLRLDDHERAHDLVRERLLLGVPDRPEVAEVAEEAVHDVRQLADERQAGTDRLLRALTDELDADDGLAEGVAGAALPDAPVVDVEREVQEGADRHQGHRRRRHLGARLQRGVAVHVRRRLELLEHLPVAQEEGRADDEGQEAVEHVGQHPPAPARQLDPRGRVVPVDGPIRVVRPRDRRLRGDLLAPARLAGDGGRVGGVAVLVGDVLTGLVAPWRRARHDIEARSTSVPGGPESRQITRSGRVAPRVHTGYTYPVSSPSGQQLVSVQSDPTRSHRCPCDRPCWRCWRRGRCTATSCAASSSGVPVPPGRSTSGRSTRR